MHTPPTSDRAYDVVIIGGALSGAATALLLLQQRPQLRVLIVEKSTAFTRRVGEATVEVSAWFLSRQLGLTQHLNEAHLVKQGMRFWFFNQRTQSLADCSEIGGRYLARVAGYQVDRAVLDEEVLRRAHSAGAELLRPASVSKIQLNNGGEQTIEVRSQERVQQIRARWVVDASGVAALLARQEGWWRPNLAHPTTAVWARWRGVKDWDGLELGQKYPDWAAACYGIRATATNHLVGDGWWAWCIPLKGGDVSIGVVFDQRLVEWPEGGSLGQRLKDFLFQHPVAREIMADAQWVEGDVHWRKNLPYHSTTYAGDGFALVGDAGAFIDPFYSPGMDWISFTATSTAELILAQQRDSPRGVNKSSSDNAAPGHTPQGEPMKERLARHNRDFNRSYERWFRAVYQDKYNYLGEYDLMKLAFLLDLGLYYLGVASQPFKRGVKALTEPVFSTPPSVPVYHLMRTYNRRFAQMARARRARRSLGARNDGRRFMFPGYTFARSNVGPLIKALFGWGWLELKEGWRSWFQPVPDPQPAPALRATPTASTAS